MDIRKNIILADIDYQKLNKDYEFFLIETAKKKNPSAGLLDVPFAEGKILAVQYTYGNSMIVMLKQSEDNKSVIKSIIDKYNDENEKCLSFKKLDLPFEKRFEHSLIQILFNSLAKRNSDSFSNLGGRFYYFCKSVHKQVVCIEFKISRGYVFSLNVVTFTQSDKDAKLKEYVLQPNNTFRPKTTKDKGKVYTKFQFTNQKNVVPFLDVTTNNKLDIKSNIAKYYAQSKIGILNKIIDKFNKIYGDIVKIGFVQETDWKSITPEASVTTKKLHLERLKNAFSGKSFAIIDTVESEDSKDLSEKLLQTIKNFVGDNATVKILKKPSKACFNIRIIHNKAYFEVNQNEEDNHKVYTDYVVQNITVEDFKLSDGEKLAANCVVILNELLVKNDLLNTKRLTLTDWTYRNDWTFCLAIENTSDEMSKFCFMKIKPDGSFLIDRISKNLFNQSEYEKLESIFASGKKIRGIVINDNNEINIIQDTDLFMLSNYDFIMSEFSNGNTHLRSNDMRDKCFGGCIDVHYEEKDDVIYYSSGAIGKGMNGKIENATHIRQILPFDNSPLFFQQVIDTMNVPFVRNGQLTVLPFPFKYLREYVKMFLKQ